MLLRIAVRRPRSGEVGTVDLPAEESELAAGRAAASALAFCSTPGSLVADTDPEQQRLTVHTLLAAGPDLRKVVRR
jgi:multisubunit Na+/H+ antiporter MnhE subunit